MGWRLEAARRELAAARRRYDVQEAEAFGDPDETEKVIADQRAQGIGPDGYPCEPSA